MGENTHTPYLLYRHALLALAGLLPVTPLSLSLSEKTVPKPKFKQQSHSLFWLRVPNTVLKSVPLVSTFQPCWEDTTILVTQPGIRVSTWNISASSGIWILSEHRRTCPKSRLTGFTNQREALSKGPKATILSPQSIQTLLRPFFWVLLLPTVPSATPEMRWESTAELEVSWGRNPNLCREGKTL